MPWIEQSEIARKNLGISMNALHRIFHTTGYAVPENYRLINNKRHYEYEKILELIKSNGSCWPAQKKNNKNVR